MKQTLIARWDSETSDRDRSVEWDNLTSDVQTVIDELKPQYGFYVTACGIGRRNRSGSKRLANMDADTLLSAILPNTDCSFSVYLVVDGDERVITIKNAHRDAMNEEYTIYPVTLRRHSIILPFKWCNMFDEVAHGIPEVNKTVRYVYILDDGDKLVVYVNNDEDGRVISLSLFTDENGGGPVQMKYPHSDYFQENVWEVDAGKMYTYVLTFN